MSGLLRVAKYISKFRKIKDKKKSQHVDLVQKLKDISMRPSTDKQISKMWSIHISEHHSALERVA